MQFNNQSFQKINTYTCKKNLQELKSNHLFWDTNAYSIQLTLLLRFLIHFSEEKRRTTLCKKVSKKTTTQTGTDLWQQVSV